MPADKEAEGDRQCKQTLKWIQIQIEIQIQMQIEIQIRIQILLGSEIERYTYVHKYADCSEFQLKFQLLKLHADLRLSLPPTISLSLSMCLYVRSSHNCN